MTPAEQLELWLEGKPVHNQDRKIGKIKLRGGECTPDFSCCHPALLAPIEIRRAFYDGGPKVRDAMLVSFMGRFLESQGCKVEYSGDGQK